VSASNNGVNRQAKAENPLLKWRLVTRLLGLLALQHQRVAALKRENERLQNLNQQRADDISFLKHSYQTKEGVNR
jgi:hypothetical protein